MFNVLKIRLLNVHKMQLLNVGKLRLLNVRKKPLLNVRKMRLLKVYVFFLNSVDVISHGGQLQSQVFAGFASKTCTHRGYLFYSLKEIHRFIFFRISGGWVCI